MKFTKLSLAAMIAMGVASSAFAVENVKVDGQLKLWYQTTDTSSVAADAYNHVSKEDGLFKQSGATGDLVAKLRATGDLTKKVGFGTTLYATTTLGLENNLVSNEAISTGASNNGGAGITSGDNNWPVWLGEAYFTYKAGKTIAKIGRQELDTPLAFTETWNAAPNTFEAAVLVNQDLPDTTVVAAYVSRGNGSAIAGQTTPNGTYGNGTVSNQFSAYGNFATTYAPGATGAGAYALGFVNKSISGLTIHPVYYNVVDSANAFWIDLAYTGLPYGIKLEGIYAYLDAAGKLKDNLNTNNVTDKTTDAYAVKVSGSVAGINLGASYSSVSTGVVPVANTATGFTKTKLYTASILSDGRIAAQPDVKSWKVEASTNYAGFDFGASYASYDVGANTNGTRLAGNGISSYTLNKDKSPSEFDFSVGTKIDEVNLTAYYIMQSDYAATAATGPAEARDKSAIRVIATINF